MAARGKYKLKRRAEHQDETRERIIKAAVSLHSQIGPGKTTISAIAKLAGVERPTVYRHFPDQLSLFKACSGYGVAAYPLPDPEPWLQSADPAVRLRLGLAELYAYYRLHATRLANILRDAESIPSLRQVNESVFRHRISRMQEVLACAPDSPEGRAPAFASLGLVLQFQTWRLLTNQGLDQEAIVELAARIAECAPAGRAGHSRRRTKRPSSPRRKNIGRLMPKP